MDDASKPPCRLMEVYRRLLNFVMSHIFTSAPDINRLQKRKDFGLVIRAAVLASLCKKRVCEHDTVLRVESSLCSEATNVHAQ